MLEQDVFINNPTSQNHLKTLQQTLKTIIIIPTTSNHTRIIYRMQFLQVNFQILNTSSPKVTPLHGTIIYLKHIYYIYTFY